jgi:hypothetical protein
MDCRERQEEKEYVDGKCYYEIVGLKTQNEEVGDELLGSKLG